MSGEQPVDPRLDRYRPMTRALEWSLACCAVLASLALVLPGRAGRWVGTAAVVLLVATPLARVLWFIARWFRRGDPKFALVGCGVLLVTATGVLLAALGV